MKTIYKYDIYQAGVIVLDLYGDAKFLHADSQHNSLCAWFEVETSNSLERREFMVYGTGHPIEELSEMKYLGTALMLGDDLVLHLYERIKK